MSGPIGSSQLMYSAGAGDFYSYQIGNSLRGSAAGDTTLKFTAGTPSSTDIMTMSFWVKRHTPNSTDAGANNVFTTGTGGGNYFYIAYNATLTMENSGGNQGTGYLLTEEKYRDPAAWYHVIFRVDTSQSTQFDRIRVYINGQQLGLNVTGQSAAWRNQTMITNTAQNEDFSYLNADGLVQSIGGLSGKGHGTEGADLTIADFMFFDGQSYYSELGETKNGVWIPKNPSGLTFGNNGYWLKFADSSDIGHDSSGNGNDFTVANFAAHDVLKDSPTFGGSSSGNFPTINPLFKHENIALSEGNLKHTCSTNQRGVMCNIQIPKTGNWYWEHLSVSFLYPTDDELHGVGVNVQSVDIDAGRGGRATGITYGSVNGGKSIEANSSATYGNAWAEGDIVGVEFDADNGTINFSKNGTFQGDISLTAAQQAKEWFPYIAMGGGTSESVGIFNFGQDSSFAGAKTAQGNADGNGFGDFYYSPPSGALALCTGNLPTPSTDPADDNEPTKNHGCLLYTGTGQGSQAQTGLGFLPDMVLIKSRNYDAGWRLFDSNRGVTQGLYLHNTDAEQDINDALTAFGSDGFTVGENAGTGQNTKTYVAWCWKANGGTTSTNSDGTLNCTQQVNSNTGFSISTYTGNGQNSTIGHGLSTIPDITMFRERGTAGNWIFRIKGDGDDNNLYPQVNNATSDGNYFQDTAATTSVASIGTHGDINGSTQTYVMWAWENKEGFSKHGLFEGNGNADGAFVHLGFSPAFLMLKSLDSTSGWFQYDNKRLGYNDDNNSLEWDVATVEQTDDQVDLLSNGFKLRTSSDPNVAETYIYMAFAAVPFKYATAR